MSPRDLSLAFLEAFCAADLERLETLLVKDLRFRGPFLAADSRAEYLSALRVDPPAGNAAFEVRALLADQNQGVLFWDYRKPDEAAVLVAQWNFCRAGRIAEIRLVFDPERTRDTGP